MQPWNLRYLANHFDFLRDACEQPRLAAAAGLAGRLAGGETPFEIADIGCGEGLLARYLDRDRVRRYVGVDISDVALDRIRVPGMDVVTVHEALEDWDGQPAPLARRILVAGEIAYYGSGMVDHLARLCALGGTAGIVISCVDGRPDKPNWQAAADRVWSQVRKYRWQQVEQVRARWENTSWTLRSYRA